MPKARDVPAKEAIKAWLSLEGMPKSQAPTPKTIIVKKQEKHTILFTSSFSKLPRERMLSLTRGLNNENIKTPRRLKADDNKTPCQSFKTPESTTEKTELGASVQPFTNTTKMERKSAPKLKKVILLMDLL